ncbi:unnamed protein product [Ixodes pacificus]
MKSLNAVRYYDCQDAKQQDGGPHVSVASASWPDVFAMTKTAKHRSVQSTNDSCVISKHSMTCRGYETDDFLHYFVSKPARRSPLINRGYYVRAKCVSRLLLKYCSFLGKQSCQILSIGAGFDTTFFRLKSAGVLPTQCRYFEIDLALVVAKKTEVINGSSELSELVGSPVEPGIWTDYCILNQDLCDLAGLEASLSNAKFLFSVPTLLLSECVLSYVDTKHSDKLVAWTARKFQDVMFVVYEQIRPYDAFGIVMLRHFATLGSPLKSLTDYPDPDALKKRYRSLGYDSCECLTMREFLDQLDPKESLRVRSLEPFDEFEELHEKCNHYVVSLARKGDVFDAFEPGFASQTVSEKIKVSPEHRASWTLRDVDASLRRFGHASVTTPNEKLLIIGGFAENGGKHQRSFAPALVDLVDLRSELLDVDLEGRQHFAMTRLDGSNILINGGRSSPLKAFQDDIFLTRTSEDRYVASNVAYNSAAPKPRWRHTLCSLRQDDGTLRVILFGGRTVGVGALGDCHILDVSTMEWVEVGHGNDAPTPRHSHAVVGRDGVEMVVACGLSAEEKALNSVHCFNVRTSTWVRLPLSGLLPRYGHTAHLINARILVLIGGISGDPGTPSGIAVVDIGALTCREVALPAQDPQRPFMTFGHTSVLTKDCTGRQIVVIVGGGGNCFSFGTHFNRQVALLDVEDCVV